MNKIRLKISNFIRWLGGSERFCEWLAPVLTVGQDINIYNISQNTDESIEIDDSIKKIVINNNLLIKEEYKPYDEEKEFPFKQMTVSPGYLGIGVVSIDDDIDIKASSADVHTIQRIRDAKNDWQKIIQKGK